MSDHHSGVDKGDIWFRKTNRETTTSGGIISSKSVEREGILKSNGNLYSSKKKLDVRIEQNGDGIWKEEEDQLEGQMATVSNFL